MATLDVTKKLEIYHTLYRLNLSFAAIVRHCATLEETRFFRSRFLRDFQGYAQELQAEMNQELLEILHSTELDDWSRYGKVRQRGCELKGLQWSDVDLFAKTLTIRKSKTAAGERTVPLTDVAASALARLRRRAEGFGTVEPSHYVFAAFAPKFTFSGKKVIDYKMTAFDPTRHLKSWRSAWRTLTKKAGLLGFRFHDLRHCAITQLAESGTSDSTIMSIAGHVSRRMLERYSHVRMEAKRNAMETLAASTKTAGYDTNHDTNIMSAKLRPV